MLLGFLWDWRSRMKEVAIVNYKPEIIIILVYVIQGIM